MAPNVERTASNDAPGKGNCSVSPSRKVTATARLRRVPPAGQGGGGPVEADDLAPASSSSQGRIPGPGRHVEHLLSRAEIHGLTEQLTNHDHGPGDDAEVPGHPPLLLAFLEGDNIHHACLPPRVRRLLTR